MMNGFLGGLENVCLVNYGKIFIPTGIVDHLKSTDEHFHTNKDEFFVSNCADKQIDEHLISKHFSTIVGNC